MNSNEFNGDGQHPDFGAEPWEQSIDPIALFEELRNAIFDFVITAPDEQTAVILWLLQSYFIKPPSVPQLCNHSAILNISSPVRACGKSTLREILEQLCPRPISMSNGSNATIYRLISKIQPTLFIDEADTFIENRAELIGILNEGYKQSGKVYRQGGKQYEESQEFSTWCAKCIVGIGSLPDTLQSRCITIRLRRKLPEEAIYRINERLEENPHYFYDLKRKIVRFLIDSERAIIKTKIELNNRLDDRTQDNWLPLLKIAKFISEDVYRYAIQASENLYTTNRLEIEYGVEILKDIKNIFLERKLERIGTLTLVATLRSNKELSWDSFPKGGLTPYHLSTMLKAFGIHPKQYKDGDRPLRGYVRNDFEDAFNRYLS